MKWILVGLVLLVGCNHENDHKNDKRWFSKDGKDCAAVIWNPRIEEWNVLSSLDKATFPAEKDAVAFAYTMCGGGELKVSGMQH